MAEESVRESVGKSENFEVRDELIENTLATIGRRIGAILPPDYGFALFIYKLGENGATFYISSCERESVIAALKEFIDREENLFVKGEAEESSG